MNSTIHSISKLFLLIVFAVVSTSSVFAQTFPDITTISDQKPGSVLIFNYYTSNPSNRDREDTQIHITNTHLQKAGSVAIYFIDSVAGAVSDGYICLAPNQMISFRASDVDPGGKGYILVVSVDAAGHPNKFNYFTGSESIKTADGYQAMLNAEAISALVESPTAPPPGEIGNGIVATLKFDGVRYNKLPGALELDYIPAMRDGNKTMVIVNQIGGSLFGERTPDNLNGLAGNVYGPDAMPYFWQEGNINSFQFRKVISNSFPQTSPNMGTLIKQGGWYGWMKFWPVNANKGVTGVVLYLNDSTLPYTYNTNFNGGRNLHHTSLTTDELSIPITAPAC